MQFLRPVGATLIRYLLALLTLLASPAAAQTVTTPATAALVCAYNSAIPTPVSGQYFFVQCDSTGKLITSGGASVLRSYIAGYTTSNDGVTPNTKINITAGQSTDSTQAVYITNTAGSVNFATTGANGLDTGSLANSTTYHIFAISKADGTSAFLGSTSLTPSLPATYVYYRRIWSIKTDGSANIIAYTQIDETAYWGTGPTQDVAVANLGTSATLYTLSIPSGIALQAIVRPGSNSTGTVIVTSPSEADVAPNGTFSTSPGAMTSSSWNFTTGLMTIYTNTSAQIRARASAAAQTFTVYTHGWIDTRGRFN